MKKAFFFVYIRFFLYLCALFCMHTLQQTDTKIAFPTDNLQVTDVGRNLSRAQNENNANSLTRWYAMSAYRQEKKAERELAACALACYVPKRYAIQPLRGKMLRVMKPAIPNLVFVHASWNEIIAFKLRHPYLQFMTSIRDGKRHVITVPDEQMIPFMRVAGQVEEDVQYFRPEELDCVHGERVRIIGGTFHGVEGHLVKIQGKRQKRVVVQIDGLIGVAASIIEPEFIQVIKE